MELFLSLIEFLSAIAVIIAAVRYYLTINKLWKRKHKKAVAESISIVAATLGICTGTPFFLKSIFVDLDWVKSIYFGMAITVGFIFVYVGSGISVRENKGVGVFRLILKALKLERKESTYLIKSFLRPVGANEIMQILQKLAAIDNDISEEEAVLIDEFAKGLGVEPPNLQVGTVAAGTTNLMELRQCVVDYIKLNPPYSQASVLKDVLQAVVLADQKEAEEEVIVLEEINLLLTEYVVASNEPMQMFEVLIVPQSEEQSKAVQELLPHTQRVERCGGYAYLVGAFYAKRFADAMRKKYEQFNLFTTTV